MALSAAHSQKHALVKLQRVLRRAGFDEDSEEATNLRSQAFPELQATSALGLDLRALWDQVIELLTPVAVEAQPATEHVAYAERLLHAGILETLLSIMAYSAPFTYDYDPREADAQDVSAHGPSVREPQHLLPHAQATATWYEALQILYVLSEALSRPNINSREVWVTTLHEWCNNGDALVRMYRSNPYLVMLDRPGEERLRIYRRLALKTLDPIFGFAPYPHSYNPEYAARPSSTIHAAPLFILIECREQHHHHKSCSSFPCSGEEDHTSTSRLRRGELHRQAQRVLHVSFHDPVAGGWCQWARRSTSSGCFGSRPE